MDSLLNDAENPTVTLSEAIDLTELRKEDNTGVCFEINEDADDEVGPTDNNYFDGQEVFENLYNVDSDDENGDEDLSPFQRLARKMVDICPAEDGGVLKQVLKQGSGPKVPLNAVVRVTGNGYLEYQDEPFDSFRLRKEQKKFRLGQGEVIEGWDIAVSSMRKGELSRFLISPDYAFGSMGAPPRIPKNAQVMFELELLGYVEHAGIDDYFSMTKEERDQLTFEDVKKVYHSLVNEGKQLFQENLERRAFQKYKKACDVLEFHHLRDEKDEKEQRQLLVRVYSNLALCSLKSSHYTRAITYCKRCEELDPKNVKALYFHGKALHKIAEFDRARQYLKRAQRQKPANREINEELEQVERDMQKFKLTETALYQKMFSNPKGQTEEEKQAEDKAIQKAIEKTESCSEQFRNMVREKLLEFKENREVAEMPMPSYNFTVGEIACILETADDIGLEANAKGSGSNSQIRVYKRRKDLFASET